MKICQSQFKVYYRLIFLKIVLLNFHILIYGSCVQWIFFVMIPNKHVVTDEDSWMKEDLESLRKENRELKEKLKQSRVKFSSSGSSAQHKLGDNSEVLSQVEGNSGVKNHILALNEAIGEFKND